MKDFSPSSFWRQCHAITTVHANIRFMSYIVLGSLVQGDFIKITP